MGSPAESILKMAQDDKVDLVVMGARGLGLIREQIFGSVSHRVMTHACCSALIVKQPLRSIKNLLIPIERQEDSNAVLTFFKKIPFREPCSITVLHVLPMVQPVWPVGAMISPEFRKVMMAYAGKFTQVLCLELERLGHQAKGLAIEGAPSVTIVEEIRKTKPDLLVMRPQSQSGVSRFFLGSVSHSVIHNTDCSILLVCVMNDEGRQTMKYLLAVDGSDQSLDATRAFEALTPVESLKVLHVVSVPGIPYPAMGCFLLPT